MSFCAADAHAFGVHGQDFFLNVPADAGLILFPYLRLEFALAIPRHGHFYVAKTRAQRLAAVSVSVLLFYAGLEVSAKLRMGSFGQFRNGP